MGCKKGVNQTKSVMIPYADPTLVQPGKTHLVGLLVGLLLLLGLLGLGDSGLSGSVSDLGLGVSLGQDGSEVGTDDSSLNELQKSITSSGQSCVDFC